MTATPGALWSDPVTGGSADRSSVQPRVERVAQPVAEEVEAEDGQGQEDAGEEDQVRRREQVAAVEPDHGSPFRRWWLGTEPEERQGCHVEDGARDPEGARDDDRGEAVREDSPEQD